MNTIQKQLILLSMENADNIRQVLGETLNTKFAEMKQLDTKIPKDLNINLSTIEVVVTKNYGLINYATGAYGLIAKNLIPQNLQSGFDVPLLGINDFFSGFKNLRNNLSQSPYLNLIYGIEGKDNLSIVTANNVNQQNFTIKPLSARKFGDMILMVFSNIDFLSGNPTNNTYVCEIVISTQQGSYANFLNELFVKSLPLSTLRYSVEQGNEAQQENSIYIFTENKFGIIRSDSLNPTAYRTSQNYLQNIIDIPLQKVLTGEILLKTYMNYLTDKMKFLFYIPSI